MQEPGLRDLIITFDKLMIDTFLVRHQFDGFDNDKLIQKIRELVKKPSESQKKIFKEIEYFDFSKEDIVRWEQLFQRVCTLAKVPIEYWNLKTAGSVNPKSTYYRDLILNK